MFNPRLITCSEVSGLPVKPTCQGLDGFIILVRITEQGSTYREKEIQTQGLVEILTEKNLSCMKYFFTKKRTVTTTEEHPQISLDV